MTTDQCPCQRPTVKLTSAYALGCRHPHALTATRNYRKRWRAGIHTPGWIDGTGTRRRLQALATLGWSTNAIGARTGLSDRWLRELRQGKNARVEHRTHTRVAAIYDQLWATPGPCPHARSHAARAGWAPPLAWDDDTIDDPAAAPHTGDTPTTRGKTAVICLDDVDHLASFGYDLDQIAARLGVAPGSIQQARRRHAQREAA